MTASSPTLQDWATQPLGKAARVAIAVGGIITATLVVLLATVLRDGAWLFLLTGIALCATSVRAARNPSLLRLTAVAANLVAIPLIAQVI